MKKQGTISLLIILLTGFALSCSKPKVVMPAEVIPADTMVKILSDMHLAEAAIQMRNLSGHDSLRSEAFGRYKYIFEKYKVSATDFEKSFKWYSGEPELFSKIYDSVIVHLSEGQAKAAGGQ